MKVLFARAEYVAHQTLVSSSLDGEDSRRCDNRLPARSAHPGEGKWKSKTRMSDKDFERNFTLGP